MMGKKIALFWPHSGFVRYTSDEPGGILAGLGVTAPGTRVAALSFSTPPTSVLSGLSGLRKRSNG